MSEKPPDKPKRKRRALAVALAVVLALVVAAPLVAWRYLTSAAGATYVRAKILAAAKSELAGRLEIDRVRLSGLLRLELDGVRLYAPGDTKPAVSIDRAVADVRATGLLAKRLDLSELTLEHPVVDVWKEDGTTNLARALARSPTKAQKEQPSTFVLHAPDIRVDNGALLKEGDEPIELAGLNLGGSVNGRADDLSVAAKTSARILQPVDREANVAMSARLVDHRVELGSLEVQSGASSLRLHGDASTDLTSGRIEIDALTLSPTDLRLVSPKLKPTKPLLLSGSASLKGLEAKAQLEAKIAAGTVELDANAMLTPTSSSLTRYALKIKAKGVEPQKLVPTMPSAVVNATLDVEGSGLPGSGSADVKLDASGSRYEGLPIEVAKVVAKVEGRRANVTTFRLVAAGATADASGEVSKTGANLGLVADVPDLAKLRARLPKELAAKLPEMAGAVHVKGRVAGPWSSPHGELSVTTPRLTYGTTRITNAQATVQLTGLSPLTATIPSAHVGALEATDLRGRNLDLTASVDGEHAHVSMKGQLARVTPGAQPTFRPVTLALEGRRLPTNDEAQQTWRLEKFSASALGLSVHSEQPSTLTFGPNGESIDQLVVGGNLGHVAISGGVGANGSLHAALTIDSLRLDRLPMSLVNLSTPIAGIVSGSASLGGTTSTPTGHAHLELTHGAYGQLAPLSGTVDASLEDGTITASIQAALPDQGLLDVEAHAPMERPEPTSTKPVAMTVSFDGISLALVRMLVPESPKVVGRIAGKLSLRGSWAAPVLEGSTALTNAGGLGVDRFDATANVSWRDGEAKVGLDLSRTPSLSAHLDASVPLDSKQVLVGPRPRLATMPMDALLTIAHADLAWLADLDFVPPTTKGSVAGRLHLGGSLRAPRLDGVLAGSAMTVGRYSNVDATLDLAADGALEAHLRSQLDHHDFVAADAKALVPPAKAGALTTDEWLKVPLNVELRLSPTELPKLIAARAMPDEEPPVGGKAAGRLTLIGSAESPVAHASFVVDELRRGGEPMGTVRFVADSSGSKTTFDGRLDSATSGSMHLAGALEGSFSASTLAALGRARIRRTTPDANPSFAAALKASTDDVLARRLDASFEAKALDLSLLEGLSQSVHGLGGRLDAKLEKHGPLSSPLVQGDVKLADGRATVEDVGAFDQLHLELAVAWPRVTLTDFSGKSGDGGFSMHGELASASNAPGFAGDFHAKLDRLPIVRRYQTRGVLSLELDAPQLVVRDGQLTLPKLVVSKGLLTIPEKRNKDVQSLDPNPDIVVAGEKGQGPLVPWRPTWRARVGIVVPDDFRIDAPLGNTVVLGANVTARVDSALASDGGSPFDLAGKVGVVRGTVQLPPLPPKFDVRPNSSLTFYSRQYRNPTLDVTATYEKSDVSVTATITGTLDHPVKNFTSKPAMDQSEILFYLATGQLQLRPQSDPFALSKQNVNDTLTSLGASIGSGIAKSFLNKYLGGAADIGELSIDTEGGGKIGTYFWNGKLYIGGEHHPNANVVNGENSWEVDGEYRFNDTTFGRVRVGDQNRNQLEILYQNNFPTSAQKKAGEAAP